MCIRPNMVAGVGKPGCNTVVHCYHWIQSAETIYPMVHSYRWIQSAGTIYPLVHSCSWIQRLGAGTL